MHKITKKIVGFKVINPLANEVQDNPESVTYLEKGDSLTYINTNVKRPVRLDNTWRLKPPQAQHALYVTLSAITIEDNKFPFEIFFNTKNPEHIEWTNALTLTISNAFRTALATGTTLHSLIENLKETIGTSGNYISRVPTKPRFVNGLVAEIGLVIEEFYLECLAWNFSENNIAKTFEESFSINLTTEVITHPCPQCGEQLTKIAGCDTCLSCGYSRCS